MLLRRKQQFKDNSLKLTNIRIILHGVVPIGQLVRRFCEVGNGGILKVVGCHKFDAYLGSPTLQTKQPRRTRF